MNNQAPQPPQSPQSWHLECADSVQHLRGLPDALFDAVITDPPYSSGGLHKGDRAKAPGKKYRLTQVTRTDPEFSGDNRDQRSFAYWSHLWLSESLRASKPGAPILCFSDWRQMPLMTDAIQAAGWTWRGIAVWDKTRGGRPSKGRFAAQAEYIIWGSKGKMPLERGVGCLPGVFSHVVRQADKHHLTGKPTPLMRELVQIAPPGALIFDPFSGSGTTGVAALLEGRRFYGIEQGADYYDIAAARLHEANAEKRTR